MIYTVKTLAQHWQCSPNHVYSMLKRGDLTGFRLGGRIWRFRDEDVARAERECLTIGWGDSKDSSSSCGRKAESAAASALERLLRKQQERPLTSLSQPEFREVLTGRKP